TLPACTARRASDLNLGSLDLVLKRVQQIGGPVQGIQHLIQSLNIQTSEHDRGGFAHGEQHCSFETEKSKNNGNGMCSRNRQNSGMDRQYQKVIFLQDLSLCRCRAPAQNIRGRAWPWHPLPFRLQGRPKEIPDE